MVNAFQWIPVDPSGDSTGDPTKRLRNFLLRHPLPQFACRRQTRRAVLPVITPHSNVGRQQADREWGVGVKEAT